MPQLKDRLEIYEEKVQSRIDELVNQRLDLEWHQHMARCLLNKRQEMEENPDLGRQEFLRAQHAEKDDPVCQRLSDSALREACNRYDNKLSGRISGIIEEIASDLRIKINRRRMNEKEYTFLLKSSDNEFLRYLFQSSPEGATTESYVARQMVFVNDPRWKQFEYNNAKRNYEEALEALASPAPAATAT